MLMELIQADKVMTMRTNAKIIKQLNICYIYIYLIQPCTYMNFRTKDMTVAFPLFTCVKSLLLELNPPPNPSYTYE